MYIYDYFELVDSANFLPLSLSDSPTDSHPNEACTELVAPDFVQKAFNAAINYELSGVTFQLTVPIQDGWNLVSIPGLHPLNQNVNTWWINKDPSTDVFRYNGIYQTVTAVAPGLGYMMKHNNSQVYNTGDEWPASGIQIVPHDPIAGTAGWNLFGGYELSVTAANVTTNPPGLQSSPIYKFSGGYQIATTIDPGYGYWINLTAPGQIIIPETLEKNGKSAEWFPNDWGRLITTDAAGKSFTLYAVNGKVNLDNYKMPPTPPTGNFDIRYSSGRIAEDINSSVKAIDMSGVTYPLTVRVEGMDIRLLDESGKRINTNLKSGEDVVISDATIQKLMVSGELLPTVYSLEQNYPNPFNPSTKISWQSPVGSWQSLKIYDVLGNEVSTFVDEYKPAGSYEVEWDASDYPSGVYFYQLRAKNFIETKKMILLR
ncbi:MAG: T9SS type A sorting domain-containing protein [bacterium]|nr:T9SS type A sorting domain-containing protein [bacterium]